jgi:hypothetical protein
MTRGRERRTAPILSHGQTTSGQCGFNPREGATDGADSVARPDHERPVRFQPSRLGPADPIKRHRARREHGHPKAMLTTQTTAVALDLLENSIGHTEKSSRRA